MADARACPDLFGDVEDRSENRAWRKRMLSWVEQRGPVVEITHSTTWKRPFYLEFAGIELMETGEQDNKRYAIIRVGADRPAAIDCEPGDYLVHVDDALGRQGRVLAVLDGSLLIDFDGQLGYLMTAEAEPPVWQMVWRSGWYFVHRHEVRFSKNTPRRRTPTRRRPARRRR
ncbi:MAG: hypothetical protein KC620_10025 [Myxococcales bacterium]|nr:hypothetical protein [Myxococcales bacterium]